jgi:hypothetical protein
MTVSQVNVLNIGLMVASCAAAFVLPFELFLFSYAVLGPLHYLTQISWLHSRGYFTTAPRDSLWLFGLWALLMWPRYVETDMDVLPFAATMVGLAFGGAFAMAFVAGPAGKAAAFVGVLVIAHLVAGFDAAQVMLLTLVPTIIHVYVFTAAFILHGALRGRSATGIASLVVFVVCSASFFLWVPDARAYVPSDSVKATYDLFADVNIAIASWLGMGPLDDVYHSRGGLVLMRLIAFAYTYHYLNWFSKTSIIQWHKIPRPWAVLNVALWLASIALYAWDYRTGMLVLFALSWLHVILEFPLDHRTFVGIGREVTTLVRRPEPAVAAPAAPRRTAKIASGRSRRARVR